jgi:hypothetical protein
MGIDYNIYVVLEIHKNQQYYECYQLYLEGGYFIDDKNLTSDSDDDFYYAYPCDSVSTLLYDNGWINSETYPKENNPWNYPKYIKKSYEKILKGYDMDKVTKIIVRKYRELL